MVLVTVVNDVVIQKGGEITIGCAQCLGNFGIPDFNHKEGERFSKCLGKSDGLVTVGIKNFHNVKPLSLIHI